MGVGVCGWGVVIVPSSPSPGPLLSASDGSICSQRRFNDALMPYAKPPHLLSRLTFAADVSSQRSNKWWMVTSMKEKKKVLKKQNKTKTTQRRFLCLKKRDSSSASAARAVLAV